MKQTKAIQLLVIDDDAVFRTLIKQAAQKHGINVTVCGSLEELKTMDRPAAFDVIVIDYFLDGARDHVTGTDIARGIGATPVILVSYSDQALDVSGSWPTSIRRFVNKKDGIKSLVQIVDQVAALSL